MVKIYTKMGDAGQTGLIGGTRVDKHDVRVTAYGCVDELNAAIGWAMVSCRESELAGKLRRIQHDLFVIGAELATEGDTQPPVRIDVHAVERLEPWLDHAWEQLPKLDGFVLPGGSEFAARLHLARTICRRTERTVVELSKSHSLGTFTIAYLNRLGDLLFAYARLANQLAGTKDVVWVSPEKKV